MTEKRFSVKKSGSGLFYRDGDYEIDNTIQFIIETVEMKLNQLSDENEQLKKENKKLQGKYDHLLWLYNGLGCEYDWLKDENEQLKQYKQSVNDVLKSWSQKNLTAKQLQVVLAIMEELNVR